MAKDERELVAESGYRCERTKSKGSAIRGGHRAVRKCPVPTCGRHFCETCMPGHFRRAHGETHAVIEEPGAKPDPKLEEPDTGPSTVSEYLEAGEDLAAHYARASRSRQERLEAFRTALYDLGRAFESASKSAESLARTLRELDEAAKAHATAARKARVARVHYDEKRTDVVNTLKRAEDEALE